MKGTTIRITPQCVYNRTLEGAVEEALKRIKPEIEKSIKAYPYATMAVTYSIEDIGDSDHN